jgi:hypothetical protein
MGGKATLQDICSWMMENYDWYRYNEGAGWEVSYLISDSAPDSPMAHLLFRILFDIIYHPAVRSRRWRGVLGSEGRGFIGPWTNNMNTHSRSKKPDHKLHRQVRVVKTERAGRRKRQRLWNPHSSAASRATLKALLFRHR